MTDKEELSRGEALARVAVLEAEVAELRFIASKAVNQVIAMAKEAADGVLATTLAPVERVEQEAVAWREVPGFEGVYEVSDKGDVRNSLNGKLLSKSLMGAGYVKASLHKSGKRTQTSVHRLVALAFLDNPDDLKNVNHINGVKTDNRVENLEWCNGSHDNLHRCYELGKGAYPIEAENIETGEIVLYPSITQCARDGFASSHIYSCIRGEIKQCNGWTFRRPIPQPAPSAAQDVAGLVEALQLFVRWVDMEQSENVTAGVFDRLKAFRNADSKARAVLAAHQRGGAK